MASYASPHCYPKKSFTVRRTVTTLIVPAEPTPYEFKPLSDIDDQAGLRFYATGLHLYKGDPLKKDQNPARVIREALAKALVYYYPIAGRLKELNGRKLVVECTGEGVVFVEAEADVELEFFGKAPTLPILGAEEFLCEPEVISSGIIGMPLLYVQVTRFKCGGFAFGLQICHVIADAPGVVQFLSAVAELTRVNTEAPSIMPVWDRQFLCARSAPSISHSPHLEYQEPITPDGTVDDVMLTTSSDKMLNRTFFFGPKQILALRKHVPMGTRTICTCFELITAAVWRSRVIALDYEPDLEVRVLFVVNARGKRRFRNIPEGFYGNALVFPVAYSTTKKLLENPLGYALELIKQAKDTSTDEFLQSAMDVLVAQNRPHFVETRTYLVSDVTRAGFENIDFGWGEGIYGGPATAVPEIASFFMKGRSEKGEEGVVVPISLPVFAMERFEKEIEELMVDPYLDHFYDSNDINYGIDMI